MTPDQTVGVLAYLAAAFPNVTLDERTPDVWIDAVTDLDPVLGVEAAKSIAVSDAWFPTIARFREVVGSLAPRPSTLGLPLPRTPLDEARVHIADLRRQLHKDGDG